MPKVAVALSGGLDSSVTAYLLKEQGYEVIGITGLMTQSDAAINVVNNAKKVAEYLNIEHYTIDATKDFQDKVINYFDSSYIKGETPNPCIMCNKFIKWGKLFNVASRRVHKRHTHCFSRYLIEKHSDAPVCRKIGRTSFYRSQISAYEFFRATEYRNDSRCVRVFGATFRKDIPRFHTTLHSRLLNRNTP